MRTAFAVFVVLATATACLADARPAGLRPGDEVVAWEPVHVAGPHAGTKTCPVCTYLDAPVLLAFAKDAAAAKKLVKPLEAIAAAHAKGKLRVLLVVVEGSEEPLKALAEDQGRSASCSATRTQSGRRSSSRPTRSTRPWRTP